MSTQEDKPIRIVRTPHSKDRPYFSMARSTAQDISLSYEALGLLTYLLSKPDSWEINIKDVAKRSTKYKAYKVLRELRKAGYVRLEKEQGAGRFSQWVYQVFETSQLLEFQQLEIQLIEIRHTQRIENESENREKKQKRESAPKGANPDSTPKPIHPLIQVWASIRGIDCVNIGAPVFTAKDVTLARKMAKWDKPPTEAEIRTAIETSKSRTTYPFSWLEGDIPKVRLVNPSPSKEIPVSKESPPPASPEERAALLEAMKNIRPEWEQST